MRTLHKPAMEGAVPASFMSNFNINTAGFVIVGMFILTWLAALLVWRFGRIEERWTARLQPAPAGSDQT
jgi:type IV secretory pathway TrbD component